MNIKYKVGDKIKFRSEKQRYTIQACNERFLVCTKPFNLQKTVLYTIVDLQENIRGTENTVFCMGAESKKQCESMLFRLVKSETGISKRNRIKLDITEGNTQC